MKNIIKKIAALSSSFDAAGLTKESAKLDGLLRSLVEDVKSVVDKEPSKTKK